MGAPKNTLGGHGYWAIADAADERSEGTYETWIPVHSAMDPINVVILAQLMNDEPLPPTHGTAARMILGYASSRNAEWLQKISQRQENDSRYLTWKNTVLRSFVTENNGKSCKYGIRSSK